MIKFARYFLRLEFSCQASTPSKSNVTSKLSKEVMTFLMDLLFKFLIV